MMNTSSNALVMKEMNIHLVRRTLKAQKQATKHQLAELTGLSTVTIGTILQKLVEENIAVELGLVSSMGGRPAQQYQFNENHAHILTLFTHEQGGLDMLYIRVANLYGVPVYEHETPLTDINLYTFEPYIDSALEAFPTIGAIGFGLPGIERDGSIIVADYPALAGTPFIAHYQERCHLPVMVENDVNAACVGHCKHNHIESGAATIYLYFPQKYPPGGGIYLNGHVYKGVSGYAGEVAMLPYHIDWRDPALYADAERISDAIASVMIATVSLLNPHSIILFGGFLTPDLLAQIQQRCAHQLPPQALPAVRLAADFTLDYQTGMIEQTLALLEPRIPLSIESKKVK